MHTGCPRLPRYPAAARPSTASSLRTASGVTPGVSTNDTSTDEASAGSAASPARREEPIPEAQSRFTTGTHSPSSAPATTASAPAPSTTTTRPHPPARSTASACSINGRPR